MHQCIARKYRIHAQYVPHELIIRAIVDDVVVGDDECVGRERANHRNFGEADKEHRCTTQCLLKADIHEKTYAKLTESSPLARCRLREGSRRGTSRGASWL